MDAYFELDVYNRDGRKVTFEEISPEAGSYTQGGYTLDTSGGNPKRFTITPDDPADTPAKITYRYNSPLRNFHKVIVPDAGRFFISEFYLVNFWGKEYVSTVKDVKMPVFIFTGQDMKPALTVGVLGQNVETRFVTRGFRSEAGTLGLYSRKLRLQFERGFDDLALPDNMAGRGEDGSLTEHIFVSTGGGGNWVTALREFAAAQREMFGLADEVNLGSLEPLWCSWTDWNSHDVDDALMLEQIEEGIDLGVRNFILDDGWFGWGLDTDTPNLGDYRPDPERFPDLAALSRKVRDMGGRLILWVGPHCVCKGTRAEKEAEKLFIVDETGEPSHNGQYYSVCFMSPEGREYMCDIVRRFITDYDVDGIKMDLFNGIRARTCTSERHEHDTSSLMVGLHRLLEEIHAAATALKPDFIIELKQNYITPFISPYGTICRSGDAPWNNEGNFMRTSFVQAYTDKAENDYMTLNVNDSALETAQIIIKMLAVGVPAYSNNFKTMPEPHKRIQKHYHPWYSARLATFRGRREPVDRELNAWRAGDGDGAAYFVVNSGRVVDIGDESAFEIVNGTALDEIILAFDGQAAFRAKLFDMFGDPCGECERSGEGTLGIGIPAGGRAEIARV